jgi:hypothetical protein
MTFAWQRAASDPEYAQKYVDRLSDDWRQWPPEALDILNQQLKKLEDRPSLRSVADDRRTTTVQCGGLWTTVR